MYIRPTYLKILIGLLISTSSLQVLSQAKKKFKTKYDRDDLELVPPAPDYAQIKYWIAHPEVKDMADEVPGKGELKEYQANAEVDVFFIYPTIYAKKQEKDHPWFADVNDEKLNKEIATSTIKYQASVFNASAKVYAPLYRQAHIGVYYIDHLPLKVEALEFAYTDVKRAFEYYLENWNNDRPIIIASHSQGTNHAVKLLRDFFENRPLMNKLVAAYIVGMPLDKGTFSYIPVCDNPTETGCWLTWNTYARDYYPPQHEFWYGDALNVNPLSWTTDTTYVSWGANRGGVLKNFKKIRPGLSDAQNMDGMLWVNKPRFFWKFLINWKRYHIVDYNLFYMNIRENVAERVEAYLEDNKED
ncbi:DUF3089 domain-containing protein [Ekhidna sp.]|jgi:hypothetical protein|uniref:DUF3089 domain-containing protein n=1 Tax=Ekhidna sp. TaxID=2608089 RepID=UPI0032EBD3D9